MLRDLLAIYRANLGEGLKMLSILPLLWLAALLSEAAEPAQPTPSHREALP